MRNEVIDNLDFDEGAGILTYKGMRYFLIRPETVGDLYGLVRKELGERGNEAFFQAGYTGVSRSLRTYKTQLGLSGESLLPFVIRIGSHLGWGSMALLSLDLDGRRMSIEVKNSVFAQAASGPEACCHMLRGVLAALGEAVFESPVSAQEVACLAKGDASCLFTVSA
jgi:predicted hydrocarbon binding protein